MNFFGSNPDVSYLDELNRLDVRIEIEGDETYSYPNKKIPITRNGHKYYSLRHRETYKVVLYNDSDRRVNAELYIDGERMGKWRINSFSHITIERPTDVNRKFVFVKENSWEASMGDVQSGKSSNGLIEVKFIPEKANRFEGSYFNMVNTSGSICGYKNECVRGSKNAIDNQFLSTNSFKDGYNYEADFSSGATVLGENSLQRFGEADSMTEDRSKIVIKRVRLLLDLNESTPFISLRRSDRSHSDIMYEDPVPPKIPPRRYRDSDDFEFYLNGNPRNYNGFYSDNRSF